MERKECKPNMSGMFLNCNTLRTLKIGTKHAESVETFENMFKDCRILLLLLTFPISIQEMV